MQNLSISKSEYSKNNNLSQTITFPLKNGDLKIKVVQNNFTAGTIDKQTRTFKSIERSPKNIFKLWNGLGINAEILTRTDFDFIDIPYLNQTLRTTRKKWLRLGTVSPFCNELVDKQIILSLDQINMDGTESYLQKEKKFQLDLFT